MLSFVMNNGIFFKNVFFTDHFFIDIIHLYLRKWGCIFYWLNFAAWNRGCIFAEKWIKSDTVLYITARTHLTGRARLLYRLKPIWTKGKSTWRPMFTSNRNAGAVRGHKSLTTPNLTNSTQCSMNTSCICKA